MAAAGGAEAAFGSGAAAETFFRLEVSILCLRRLTGGGGGGVADSEFSSWDLGGEVRGGGARKL